MAGDTFAGFSGRYGGEAVLTTLVGNHSPLSFGEGYGGEAVCLVVK